MATRYDIEAAKNVAKHFNGEFLDKEFKGNKYKHRWRSQDGIEFTRTLDSILNNKSFEPRSSTKERLCRFIFQSLFDTSFPKSRPVFLGGLELDGYASNINLAFEYQGKQHDKHIPHFHTPEEFEALKRRDEKKLHLCREHGIHLMIVPQETTLIEEIRDLIISYCERNGINVIKPSAPIEPRDATQFAELQEMNEASQSPCHIEIISVSGDFAVCYCTDHNLRYSSRLPTLRQALKRGSGCLAGRHARTLSKDPRVKRLEDYRMLAENNGMQFLGERVPERTLTKALWTCSCCQKPFKKSYSQISNGRTKCMECTKKMRLTIDQMHRWAADHNGRCLTKSLEMKGRTMVRFVDQFGEPFERRASFVVNDGLWPTNRKKVAKHNQESIEALLIIHKCCIDDPIFVYRNNIQKIRIRCNQCGAVMTKTLRQLKTTTAGELCSSCVAMTKLKE